MLSKLALCEKSNIWLVISTNFDIFYKISYQQQNCQIYRNDQDKIYQSLDIFKNDQL